MINEERTSVFISYSTVDQIIAEGICGFMEAHKIRCFVAYRDIPKSVDWAKVIPPAIRDCRLMVAVFSKSFNLSEETDNEIHIAAHHKIPILTFRIVDEEFEGTKEYFLTKSNWLDAFPEPEKHFGDLLRNIQVMLGLQVNTLPQKLSNKQLSSQDSEEHKLIGQGLCLLNGLGTHRDPMMAAFQLRKVAKTGNADGQYWMGRCCWSGWGVAQSWKDAFDWFSQAANQGHSKAMCELAKMYHYGIGVKYNPMRALEFYTLAAEACSGEAMYYLGKVYRSGELGIQDEQRSSHYYSEAFERLYEQAMDNNDADAQYRLGNMYNEGEGVSRDYTQAIAWYERSEANGNVDSTNAMALMYQDGRGVREDESRSFELKYKAARNDCRMAQNNIGHDYSHGWGCEKNLDQWLEWKLKSANGGYALAQASLALSYQYGKENYLKADWGKAKMWYEKAIESGSLDAMFFMAKNYENCNMGLAEDKGLAFQLYKHAAVLGYVPAWWAVGHCFYYGNGITKSHIDAFRWYNQLLDAFLQWRKRLEERWYFSSGAGTISGYRLDFLLDAGLVRAFENLSWLFRYGDNVEHNENKASICDALKEELRGMRKS